MKQCFMSHSIYVININNFPLIADEVYFKKKGLDTTSMSIY